jgi:TP901 family phage tail tape measure protein
MADVNANIGVHIDTSAALAELKNLQRQLATFHSSVAKNSAAAAAAQKGLQTNLLNSINATGKFRAQMGLVRTSTESFTHALETNKLSMREYFRYASGSTKTFGRLFKQEFNTIGKVAEERVKKMQTQYIKMGRDASGAMKAISITPNTLNMKDYSTKLAVAAQKQAILNQLLKQGSTNLLNFGKNTQWAGRQLMVGFTIPLAYFGTAAAKTFMDLEKQAVKFKRVYGDMFTTTDETNKALADVQKLAEGFTKYGVAVADTMEMAASAAAMGKTGAELTAQVAQATRLAVLGGVEQGQALETTISVTNAFGIAADELANKINFLNAVENQTVVSIEDLTEAIPKAGPVVKQLGGSVEDLAFFLTAMKEGGINASEGANALKSGLASLINPSKKASEMLGSMGINIKAIVEGNAGNIRETVIDFAQALDTLDPLNRARAIEQLFGKFQFSRLSTLFQNVTQDGTQASKVLQLAGASIEELAILSERELGTIENAVGVNFKESIEKLKLSIAPIGKTFLEAVTPIVQVVGRLLDKFNNLGDGTKKFLVVATTLVGVIGPVLLMTFGLLANGIANIIKLFITMRSGFLKAGTNTNLLAQQTQYLNSEQLESATVAASLNQAHTRLTQSFGAETTAVRLLRQAYIDATIAATNFARTNPGMMVPGFKPGMKGGKLKGFASGTTGLPGPRGAGDVIPLLGAPGEAIIPAKTAQDDRFKPIIQALVNGTIQGFEAGTVNVGGKSFTTRSQSAGRNLENKIIELKSKGISEEKIVKALETNIERGRPMTASQLERRLSINRGAGSGTSAPSTIRSLAKQSQSGFATETSAIRNALKSQGVSLTPGQEKNLFNVQASHIEEVRNSGTKQWNAGNLVADLGYVNNYLNTVKGKLGQNLLGMSDDQLRSMGIDRNELKKLQSGTHPTTAAGAQTLRSIAAYDAKINPNSYQAKAVIAGLEHRSKNNFYSQPMKTLSGMSSVKTGSTIVDDIRRIQQARYDREDKALLEAMGSGKRSGIVNGQTGVAKPSALGVVGGGSSDTRQVAVGKGESILTKKTTASLRAGKGVFIPGMGRLGIAGAIDGIPKGQTQGGTREIPFSSASGVRIQESQMNKLIESLDKNTETLDDGTKTTTKLTKDQKREVRANRAASVGRVAGPVAGLAGIGAMAGFASGNAGVGTAMMGVSAIATIAPMLTNPIGIAVAAAATLAGGFLLLNKRMDDATKKQVAYINSVTAGTKQMQKIGELTGNVGASQIAQKQRETGARVNEFRTGYDRGGNQFGTNFLASDIGKEIFKGFNDTVAKDGDKAAQLLATQLSAYISDGVMSAEQANSVARAIGINLGDMSISTNISGELRELVGPDGQDLLTDPLEVRLNIISSQAEMSNELKDKIDNFNGDGFEYVGYVAQAATANAKNLEIIQAQRDAQWQTNQVTINNLEKQKTLTTDKAKQLQLENQIVTAKTKQKSEDQILAEKSSKIIKDAEDLYNLARTNATGSASRASGAYIDALQAGIKQAQKDNPFLNTFIEKGAGLQSVQLEAQINTAVLGGQLSIPTALKLMEMFSGTEGGEAKLKGILETTVVSQNPGVVQAFFDIVSGKKIDSKITTEILDPANGGSFEDRVNVLNKLKDFDGDSINLTTFINEKGTKGIDQLAKDFKAIEKIKSPITLKTVNEIATITSDPNLDMSGLVSIWDKYKNSTDEIKKTVIQEYIVVYKSIGDKEAKDLINSQLSTSGSPDNMDRKRAALEAKYFNKDGTVNAPAVAGALVSQRAAVAPNTIPSGGIDSGDTGTRLTYLDELLKKLKLTRDASINAQGGIQELVRVMSKSGGDIKIFKGISQQLKNSGVNEEFINFVNDLDPAIQKKFITIKNGIVTITKDGKALAAALNEAVLGELQAGYDLQIQGLKAQSDKFIELKTAGLSAAEALSIVTNEQVALALASGKSKEEIDGIISKLRELRTQETATLKTINPAQYVEKQVSMALEYYDVLERETRNTYQPQIDAINTLIDANEKLIDVKQREIEINYDRPIAALSAQSTILNHDLSLIDKAAESINKKYDEQEKALSQISEISDQIAEQEKRRITIADALTQGDISAAAKAIQDERQAAANAAQETSLNLIQAAREKELSALRSANGLTRLEIENKLYAISEQIYALEQKQIPVLEQIKKLQDDNYNYQVNSLAPLQAKLDAELLSLDAQRKKWTDIQLGADGAKVRSKEYNDVLLNAEDTLKRMKALWDDIGKSNIKSAPVTQNSAAVQAKTEEIKTQVSDELFKNIVSGANPNDVGEATRLKLVQEFKNTNSDPFGASAAASGRYTAQAVAYYQKQLKDAAGAKAMGGIIPKYFVAGGYSRGSDTVPAMLTPGEFVVRKNAVDSFGVNNLNKINDGSYGGSSVYNYSLNVNVKSDANPNDIARTVMTQIKQIDNQRIRTQRGA